MMIEQTDLISEPKLAFLFQPDTVFPAQYLETYGRRTFREPEKTLLLAVLEDGIRCFQDNVSAQSANGRKLFEQAQEWILEKDSDRIFSFENTCEVLGINPEYVRQGLLRWKQQKLSRPDANEVREVRAMVG